MLSLINPSVAAQQEKDLFEQLIIEDIQVAGIETIFIRKDTQPPSFLNESIADDFKDKIVIEAGIKRIDNFDGQADLFSKFGFMPMDSCTLVYSIRRFREESQLQEPDIGDLVYTPLNRTMWEIRRVKTDDVMMTSGIKHTFVIDCVVYQPGTEEDISDLSVVGNPDLDFLLTPPEEVRPPQEQFQEDITVVGEQVFDPMNPFGDGK